MGAMISDEFTKLPISRQRKYQFRKIRDGLCRVCGGSPCDKRSTQFCREHWHEDMVRARERARARNQSTKRYQICESYQYPSGKTL